MFGGDGWGSLIPILAVVFASVFWSRGCIVVDEARFGLGLGLWRLRLLHCWFDMVSRSVKGRAGGEKEDIRGDTTTGIETLPRWKGSKSLNHHQPNHGIFARCFTYKHYRQWPRHGGRDTWLPCSFSAYIGPHCQSSHALLHNPHSTPEHPQAPQPRYEDEILFLRLAPFTTVQLSQTSAGNSRSPSKTNAPATQCSTSTRKNGRCVTLRSLPGLLESCLS